MKPISQSIIRALIVSTTFVGSSAHAQNADFDDIDCKKASTQLEMNHCAYKSFKAADAELNQVYRQLRNKYKGTPQESQLMDAQLAWLKFRDTDCKFSADRFKGGSIAPLIYSSCQQGLTTERTRSLKNYLEMTEN
jgi:uncharacterized protein YecT (DUF1311 family)